MKKKKPYFNNDTERLAAAGSACIKFLVIEGILTVPEADVAMERLHEKTKPSK